MAEKETRNKPKDVVEAIPEEIVILESDGEVAEQLEELEIASEPGRELSKEEKEEEKRIFYVAVTRAKELLILCGAKNGKGFWRFLQENH